MVVVYMPGVFDLLHIGHVRAIEQASKLGNRLIVGVPSDGVVRDDKGQLPIITLNDRAEMLQSLRAVSVVAPYFTLDFVPHLERFQPQILAVGSTWGQDARHVAAERWAVRHGARLVKIPYYDGESTTSIKKRIIKQWQRR